MNAKDTSERSVPPVFKRIGLVLVKAILWAGVLLALMQIMASVRAPDLPENAPEFALQTLDGETVRLADFRGQTVVLNFWASWCLPCRIEVPALKRFAGSHPDVIVLGVAGDRDDAAVREAVRELGITYPVVLGDSATLAAYGVSTYPTTVIVGPEGEVVRAYTGLLLDPHLAWATR